MQSPPHPLCPVMDEILHPHHYFLHPHRGSNYTTLGLTGTPLRGMFAVACSTRTSTLRGEMLPTFKTTPKQFQGTSVVPEAVKGKKVTYMHDLLGGSEKLKRGQ